MMTKGEFDAMLVHKKESAARVDGFPYSAYRSARGTGIGRTVSITKSTVVDGRVRTIGS